MIVSSNDIFYNTRYTTLRDLTLYPSAEGQFCSSEYTLLHLFINKKMFTFKQRKVIKEKLILW